MWGRGLERPGDGVASLFLPGDFGQIFGRESRIKVVICNQAEKLDRTAQLPTSTTPQSTSARGGGGWNARGMALPLRFLRGVWLDFYGGGGVG